MTDIKNKERRNHYFRYENGGFESSFTPAQLQQIRRISLAQVLCRTLDTISNIQPFAFLSPDHEDNERISCQNGLLNDFDLSPWIEIDSENNDIRKSDDDHTTQRPKRTKPTTAKPNFTTTSKKTHSTSKNHLKRPQNYNLTKTTNTTDHKLTDNVTDANTKDDRFDLSIEALTRHDDDKLSLTVHIDDKLDFKNKTRRFDNNESIDSRNSRPNNKYGDYEYEDDDTQSIQSVIVNNAPHKRPYNNYNNRPSVLTVTENTNKYTYLINYVPRPTESYRQTTRRSPERDVVKVTYQTYDDTYRRPNKPYYYNRHEFNENYRSNRPNTRTTMKDNLQSSARSNDGNERTTQKVMPTENTTLRPRPTDTVKHKTDFKTDVTTDNMYKLVTFGYVGSYRGDMADNYFSAKAETENSHQNKELKQNIQTDDDKNRKSISKDFSTYPKSEPLNKDVADKVKLSTFYLYESATKPYNLQRSTRRNDEEEIDIKTSNKYYYVNNVLRKRPRPELTTTDKPEKNLDLNKEIIKENYNYPGLPQVDAEERSSLDNLPELEANEPKTIPNKMKVKVKKPSNPAKTPSVAFQVIPSEVR